MIMDDNELYGRNFLLSAAYCDTNANMQQVVEQKMNYGKVLERQEIILREIDQIKTKMRLLGSLGRFKEVARRGQQFAKKHGITQKDVLEND
ncbi:MAG: hypothetical protein G01um101429_98 [Parcubacteria group bacterium Gr01-1014_29]|nr:MAG: hypothetical protein G01um101429_98 [Parcubacteria group bacterium Gr01-1014_29]